MNNILLDDDEGVLKSYNGIELGISNKIECIDEFYLTNKGLSYKYQKSIGLFKPNIETIEKHLYSDIKVIDNKINVFKINDDDNYGDGIRIFYNGGVEEFYIFYNENDLEECYNTIIEKVKNKKNIKEKNEIQNNQIENNDISYKEAQETFVSKIVPIKENIEKVDDSPKLVSKIKEEIKTKYCSKCGKKIDINSKFCMFCGNNFDENLKEEIKLPEEISKTERKTIYQGEIHKCPNCGEILKSFVGKCPSCGLEINNLEISNSLIQFVNIVNECEEEMIKNPRENSRGWKSWGLMKKLGWIIINIFLFCIPLLIYFVYPFIYSLINVKSAPKLSKEEQKLVLAIENFVYPNDKESIMEMLIFAKGKMENNMCKPINRINVFWFNTWNAFSKKMIDKGLLLFTNDSLIQQTNENIQTIVSKHDEKVRKKALLGLIIVAVYIVIYIINSGR